MRARQEAGLTRMSFVTERTPCTFCAAPIALLAMSSESTNPLSDTVPRNVSTLMAVDFTPGSLMSAVLTRAVSAASSTSSPVDWRVCVGAQPAAPMSAAAASAAPSADWNLVIVVASSVVGAASWHAAAAPRGSARADPQLVVDRVHAIDPARDLRRALDLPLLRDVPGQDDVTVARVKVDPHAVHAFLGEQRGFHLGS